MLRWVEKSSVVKVVLNEMLREDALSGVGAIKSISLDRDAFEVGQGRKSTVVLSGVVAITGAGL